jgi:N-acetylmuramoyl-L-alanine amidase
MVAVALTFGHAMAACEPGQFPIALDIGHSADATGAISARGVPERDFNVALGAEVAAVLQAEGFTDLLVIAGDDAPIKLADRARRADAYGAEAFLSLHHDSVQPRYLRRWTVAGREVDYTNHARGYSLFVSARNPRYDRSVELATAIGEAMREAGLAPSRHHAEPIEGENRPLVDQALGIYRYDGLAVLRSSDAPAVLVEAGVIKNPNEEVLVGTDAFRERLAEAIAAAVWRFCEQDALARDPEVSASQ